MYDYIYFNENVQRVNISAVRHVRLLPHRLFELESSIANNTRIICQTFEFREHCQERF